MVRQVAVEGGPREHSALAQGFASGGNVSARLLLGPVPIFVFIQVTRPAHNVVGDPVDRPAADVHKPGHQLNLLLVAVLKPGSTAPMVVAVEAQSRPRGGSSHRDQDPFQALGITDLNDPADARPGS